MIAKKRISYYDYSNLHFSLYSQQLCLANDHLLLFGTPQASLPIYMIFQLKAATETKNINLILFTFLDIAYLLSLY